MFKKAICGISLILLSIGILSFAFTIQQVRADSTTIIVPDGYPTIQEAINHANNGDTVYVKAGTYIGHITVNKSIVLIGHSNQDTFLRVACGDGTSVGCHIVTANVAVTGFHITYNEPMVVLLEIDGRLNSSNVLIQGNILVMEGSDNVALVGSHDNSILDNVLSCDQEGAAIVLEGSHSNVIKNNRITGSFSGVYSAGSSNNTIAYNVVTGQTQFDPDIVCGGIHLNRYSHNNLIVGNNLTKNECGISFFQGPSDNIFYHNNVINNTMQFYVREPSDALNSWNDDYPSGGNYWSNYTGIDEYAGPYQNETGSDGIGDTPYSIGASGDLYPLMKPWVPSFSPTCDIHPCTLNLETKRDWIAIMLEFSEGYSVIDINSTTINVNKTFWPDSSEPVVIGDYDMDSKSDLTVKFNATEVANYILSKGILSGNVSLTITWQFVDGALSEANCVLTVKMPGDVNADGVVNGKDAALVGLAFGSSENESGWNQAADENEDGYINAKDVVLIGQNFGKTYS